MALEFSSEKSVFKDEVRRVFYGDVCQIYKDYTFRTESEIRLSCEDFHDNLLKEVTKSPLKNSIFSIYY